MNQNEASMRELITRSARRKNIATDTQASGVDWDLIRRRIADSSARLAWVEELTDEALQHAWSRRAAQVAQALDAEDLGERLETAIFRLGRELYGIDVQYVYDIRTLEQITPVPRVPAWVAGVVNLRGRILSVLDLQRYLGLLSGEAEAQGDARHLVLVETPEMELALLVDEMIGIRALPASNIQEATTVVRGLPIEYIQGVYVDGAGPQSSAQSNGGAGTDGNSNGNGNGTSRDASLLVILNLPAVLADPKLIVHEEVA